MCSEKKNEIQIDILDVWGVIFVKLGRPFLGWFIKMGQVRTRDGWGVKKGLKKRDVLYGRSLTNKTVFC